MPILRLLLLIILLGTTSCENMEYPQSEYVGEWQSWPIDTDWVMGEQVLFFINDFRSEQGLLPLKADKSLITALSASHSNYMISQNEISHEGFNDRAKILKQNGAITVGENVAAGYDDPFILVNAWSNSPPHRETMEGNYTHAGLGIRKDVLGRYYYTLILVKK